MDFNIYFDFQSLNLQNNAYSVIVFKNYVEKLNSFKSLLSNWSYRNLSLMGKVTVVKTFALPKLKYALTVLQNPSQEQRPLIKKKFF